MNSLVSVIIPAYNCENTIGEAISSIQNQTYRNLEIIVVDDHSTDRTKSIVMELTKNDRRIKIIDSEIEDNKRFNKKTGRNINAGYSARNTGLKYVKGEYITFQDADDASLLNRIEVQLHLLNRYNATLITTDWCKFDTKLVGKSLNIDKFSTENAVKIMTPQEIINLSKKTKGICMRLPEVVRKNFPFWFKRLRIINKLFFGSLKSYPGIPGIPFFRKEVITKVTFRELNQRVWPSFTGRGADRDFDFNVAQQFKNSYYVSLPLYLWRVNSDNEQYPSDFVNIYII